ncbi:heavy metal translocating P-type ATPase [Flavitalea flava]
METINWKIEGMTCSTCALTIGKYLERQGMSQVKVSLASGDLSFENAGKADPQKLRKGIEDLGYSVVAEGGAGSQKEEKKMNRHLRNLLICLPFTLMLLLHMAGDHLPVHWLMLPWVQFVLCLPVFIVGMNFFGRSAVMSLLNGLPNMNVLIAVGAAAAFLYSLAGTLWELGPAYLFYETAASIITLVFFGYYLEDVSVQSTQKALKGLARSQKAMANMIAFDGDHQEQIFPVESTELRSGDLILIRSGEQVPADGKILWGEASVNEAIITGESLPLHKKPKDSLIGGSILLSGTVKVQVTAAGEEAVLAGIIRLVKQAQGEKPPMQQLADKISAIFVPLVLGIALITFVINFVLLKEAGPSLMRAVAVLVIACPCAMGLATPAAIAVGLGRAARQGILFRHARGLESFASIRQVVFDKTGTLTTGEFSLKDWGLTGNTPTDEIITEDEFKRIAFSLEKYSTHPIARCIARDWKTKGELRWAKIEEIKGLGMRGETKNGDIYLAGSYKIGSALVGSAGENDTHNVYIFRNERLLGWIDVADTVRPEAAEVVQALHARGIRTVLLSGDRLAPCRQLAGELGIEEVLAEQTPEQKMEKVARLTAQTPTAMVGDGINDAPALAKATIGISMSDASQLAMQTADLVLMNHGLKQLPAALSLGKYTFLTIRQNLFWAFFYNSIAIPVAALGLLKPAFAALAMGLSDVVLVFNSVRLFVKKLP